MVSLFDGQVDGPAYEWFVVHQRDADAQDFWKKSMLRVRRETSKVVRHLHVGESEIDGVSQEVMIALLKGALFRSADQSAAGLMRYLRGVIRNKVRDRRRGQSQRATSISDLRDRQKAVESPPRTSSWEFGRLSPAQRLFVGVWVASGSMGEVASRKHVSLSTISREANNVLAGRSDLRKLGKLIAAMPDVERRRVSSYLITGDANYLSRTA